MISERHAQKARIAETGAPQLFIARQRQQGQVSIFNKKDE
jgi:hypothetical protein